MKNLISVILILTGLNAYSQDSIRHWKSLDKSTTLRTHIENEAYQYLDFHPDTTLTALNDSKIKIRDGLNVQKPLLIINDSYVNNDIVLNHIILAEVLYIDIQKPSAKLSAIYGSLVQYGLISVTMNKRKWNTLRRKFKLDSSTL